MRFIIQGIIGVFIINLLVISAVLFWGQYLSYGVIAYTSSSTNTSSTSTVMVIDAHTGVSIDLIHNIAEGDVSGRTPVWSPDGDFVAFWTFHNRNDTLAYEIEWDNFHVQDLTTQYQYFSLPIYGANNQKLFTTFPSYNRVPIMLFNDQHPEGQQIIPSTLSIPVWSPDGRSIAFITSLDDLQTDDTSLSSGVEGEDVDIYVINTETQEIKNLTTTTNGVGIPIWSPDGTQIVFVSGQLNFRSIDVESGEINEITVRARANDHPIWSPDGRYLAFTSSQRIESGLDIEVMVLDMETFELRNVSNSMLYDNQPTWSSDGRFLAFVSRREGNQDDIYVANIENNTVRRLTYTDMDESDIAWKPR